jgi:pimeloyl-ACP methyl ester carboxylesterase
MDQALVRAGEVRVDGVRTPVIESGPEGDRDAVVFVHGNPGSSEDWRDLLARTGAFARAIAIDMPGFGQADKPSGFIYTVTGFARFLGKALDALGAGRVHLVVHDFGGPFGLAWAAEHPDAFASVAIVNAPPVSDYRWYLLAKVWRTPGAGELLHWTLTPPTFRWLIRRGNPRGLSSELVERMRRDYDRGTQRCVLRLYRATDAKRMVPAPPSAYRILDRPALIVWGEQDIYIPRRFAEQHRDAFPSAEIVYLPGSGHFAMADDPEGVANAVIPFLQRVTSGSP